MINQQQHLYQGDIDFLNGQQLIPCQININETSILVIKNTAVVFHSLFSEDSLRAEWLENNQMINQLNLIKENHIYQFKSSQSLLPLKEHLDGRIGYLNFDQMHENIKNVSSELKIVRNKVTQEVHTARYQNLEFYKETLIKVEIRILLIFKNQKHKNIAPFRAYYVSDNNYILLYDIQQCAPLFQLLKQNPQGLSIQEAGLKIKQLLKGLSCIHKCNIVLRDLNQSSVYVTGAKNKVKILDMYYATKINEISTVVSVGSPGFIAPEIFQQEIIYTEKTDIFGAGIIFHYLLTGKSIYQSSTEQSLVIMNKTNNQKILYDKIQDPQAIDLLKKMLDYREHRPTAEDCLKHNFFKTLKQEHQEDKVQQILHIKIKSQHKN